jgi:hypothetical protein
MACVRCGLDGFKPNRNRVTRSGDIGIFWSEAVYSGSTSTSSSWGYCLWISTARCHLFLGVAITNSFSQLKLPTVLKTVRRRANADSCVKNLIPQKPLQSVELTGYVPLGKHRGVGQQMGNMPVHRPIRDIPLTSCCPIQFQP